MMEISGCGGVSVAVGFGVAAAPLARPPPPDEDELVAAIVAVIG
jgi:hypothetical protein